MEKWSQFKHSSFRHGMCSFQQRSLCFRRRSWKLQASNMGMVVEHRKNLRRRYRGIIKRREFQKSMGHFGCGISEREESFSCRFHPKSYLYFRVSFFPFLHFSLFFRRGRGATHIPRLSYATEAKMDYLISQTLKVSIPLALSKTSLDYLEKCPEIRPFSSKEEFILLEGIIAKILPTVGHRHGLVQIRLRVIVAPLILIRQTFPPVSFTYSSLSLSLSLSSKQNIHSAPSKLSDQY